MKKEKVVAFHYFGGKSPFLDWLYQHFPKDVHLIDCMCGSASVGLNADYKLITINDINKEVINFFEVLRNNYDRFIHQVKFTPFSREEFYKAAVPARSKIERARRFYVRALQGYAGMGSQNDEKGWGYEVSPIRQYNRTIRNHFRVDTWCSKVELLEVVADRLKHMQIENLTVFDLINKYDRQGVLIYIDPPYVRSLRRDKKRYRHEFDDQDHYQLAARVNECKCYVAISGYEGSLYDDLFPADKWYKIYNKVSKANTKKLDRREVLWTNYNPFLIGQTKLFQDDAI